MLESDRASGEKTVREIDIIQRKNSSQVPATHDVELSCWHVRKLVCCVAVANLPAHYL